MYLGKDGLFRHRNGNLAVDFHNVSTIMEIEKPVKYNPITRRLEVSDDCEWKSARLSKDSAWEKEDIDVYMRHLATKWNLHGGKNFVSDVLDEIWEKGSVLNVNTRCRDYHKRHDMLTNARELNRDDITYIFSITNSYEDWVRQFTAAGVRKYMPYGMWVTAAGEVVLYNRKYQPFMSRPHNGQVRGCDPTRWVEDITMRYYFYNDNSPINTPDNWSLTKTQRTVFNRCCRVIQQLCDGAAVEELEKLCIIKKGLIDGEWQRQTFQPDIVEEEMTKEYVIPEPVECPECGKMCAAGGALTSHMKHKHLK